MREKGETIVKSMLTIQNNTPKAQKNYSHYFFYFTLLRDKTERRAVALRPSRAQFGKIDSSYKHNIVESIKNRDPNTAI